MNTQAVFSLRGKPLNSYGLTKKVVYENEEFNLLQAALNIEDGLEDLRYNNVIIATDADVDGMHIRLLLLTFFLSAAIGFCFNMLYECLFPSPASASRWSPPRSFWKV